MDRHKDRHRSYMDRLTYIDTYTDRLKYIRQTDRHRSYMDRQTDIYNAQTDCQKDRQTDIVNATYIVLGLCGGLKISQVSR